MTQIDPQIVDRVRNIYMENVPPRYHHMINFATIAPSEASYASVEFQRRVISCIQDNNNDGFAFFGPSGVGKTALACALYAQALFIGFSRYGSSQMVWRTTAMGIINEHTQRMLTRGDPRPSPVPTLTTVKIKNARTVSNAIPRAFIGEMDKPGGTMTEYKTDTLFAIIEELYAQEGRLTLDTNLKKDEAMKFLGDKVLRRIGAMSWRIDYFEETIKPPIEPSCIAVPDHAEKQY
jgi:hypothetical protein